MTKNDDDLYMELFEEPEKKFKQHLQIENNERIIFSGKFGHGKTTFLREFFTEDNQKANFKKKKYNVISLFPVNYSIASNEDIFRYIKYDIILEMLTQGYKIEDSIEGYYQTLPEFLKKNFDKVFASILFMIPHVGKEIVESYERWDKLKDEYLKHHSDSKLLNNTGDQFIDYMEKLEQTEGSLYEDDLVSKLIEKILKEKLEKEDADENVLLIDDLDRIDPEHIFRILNVFAAHFDRKNELQPKNKFGFDKIIIVCDIENIRNIFKAKYGAETDFNGYIDKFYSYEVFNFNHRKAIEDYSLKMIYKANWEYSSDGARVRTNDADTYRSHFLNSNNFFNDVLLILFDNKQIDLRNLLKFKNLRIQFDSPIIFKNNNSINVYELPILLSIKLLCKIKGSPESLKHSLNNLKGETISLQLVRNYIEQLLYINMVLEHNFKEMPDTVHTFKIDDIEAYLKFDQSGKKYNLLQSTGGTSIHYNKNHLFWLLSKTIDFLVGQNILP